MFCVEKNGNSKMSVLQKTLTNSERTFDTKRNILMYSSLLLDCNVYSDFYSDIHVCIYVRIYVLYF